MRIKNYFKKFTLLALFLFGVVTFSFAQNTGAPREQKLLNGMKLLVWTDLKAEKTSVKLRIHSGSAFDPQTKEGVMALLADILFPTDAAREYFEEDLGGSIEITSNYDYIQVNTTGDNDKILEILEALATAVSKPQIDKDTTARVKTAKLEKVKALEKDPAYIADRAVAKRLFGSFPYGRPPLGSTESLSKIDFADVLLAKQKFLTADNATLAVSGNVKFEFVYRAARRLFGGWEKADKKVPATFTAPDAPDNKSFLIKTEIENVGELRYTFRGLARNDKDFAASQILIEILQNRIQAQKGDFAISDQPGFVRHETHLLPGGVIFAFSNWNVGRIKMEGNNVAVPGNMFTFVGDLMKSNVESGEFESAKNDFLTDRSRQNPLNWWLDADTFKFVSVKDDAEKANNVQLADVQNVLERWRKESVVTALLVTAK
jgi:hypothetical protein